MVSETSSKHFGSWGHIWYSSAFSSSTQSWSSSSSGNTLADLDFFPQRAAQASPERSSLTLSGHVYCSWVFTIVNRHGSTKRCFKESPGFWLCSLLTPLRNNPYSQGNQWRLLLPILNCWLFQWYKDLKEPGGSNIFKFNENILWCILFKIKVIWQC